MFSWISFLTYALITAATPGPNNLASLSIGGRLGFRKALPFNLGIWVGFSVLAVLCTLASSLLSALIPKIKLPMLVVGAVYILHLAWNTFHAGGELEESAAAGGFRLGVILQFLNPKAYLYCILSMEAYILPYYGGQPLALLLFALLLAWIGAVFTVCWSAFGSVFRVLFSKYAKITNTIMALLLVYCAISLFL